MKKILVTILFVGASLVFGASETSSKNPNLIVNDLIKVPFPGGKMFKTGKIKLSDEQQVKFATEVRPIMHEKYNPLLQEIFVLEKKLQREVVKKATTYDESLKTKVDEIAKLKHEAINYKLEALLKIKSILTKEQWQVWVSN